MEITNFFLIVVGILIIFVGFIISIVPDEARNWFKKWMSLPDNLFCLSGYLWGLIGMAIIIVALVK